MYFGAAGLALILTPLVIRLARRIGAIDRPGIRSVHTHPIPRIGGVAIYLSAACTILVLLLNHAIGERLREVRPQVVTLLVSATGIFLLGLVDDLKVLSARWKFLAEFLGAGALCLVGVRIDSIGLGGGPGVPLGWLGWLLTILWIVGITNAVNMSDGLDGLAAGLSAIACGVIAIFAIYSGQGVLALLVLALLGSLSGFLVFNFHPAKVFMGDCGSLFLGFTIAAASVLCASKKAALVGLALPALALGIPIFDTLLSMLRRFLERRSMFAPDRSHFHHRMLELGFNQRWAVLAIYALTLLAAGLGLFMMVGNGHVAVVVFAAALALILLVFRLVGVFGLHDTLARLQQKYRSSHRAHEEQRVFENLQLRFRQVHGDSAWWPALCEAAQRMDFAWVSLKTVHADGRTNTEIWRRPDERPADLSRLITMTIPFRNGDPDCRHELEIAVHVNESYESAGHRGTLFARLLDEHAALAGPPQHRRDLKN
ncbi:MAG: glycosyltransferase family 4 protein [Solirubrobacterales bacterium]